MVDPSTAVLSYSGAHGLSGASAIEWGFDERAVLIA